MQFLCVNICYIRMQHICFLYLGQQSYPPMYRSLNLTNGQGFMWDDDLMIVIDVQSLNLTNGQGFMWDDDLMIVIDVHLLNSVHDWYIVIEPLYTHAFSCVSSDSVSRSGMFLP